MSIIKENDVEQETEMEMEVEVETKVEMERENLPRNPPKSTCQKDAGAVEQWWAAESLRRSQLFYIGHSNFVYEEVARNSPKSARTSPILPLLAITSQANFINAKESNDGNQKNPNKWKQDLCESLKGSSCSTSNFRGNPESSQDGKYEVRLVHANTLFDGKTNTQPHEADPKNDDHFAGLIFQKMFSDNILLTDGFVQQAAK